MELNLLYSGRGEGGPQAGVDMSANQFRKWKELPPVRRAEDTRGAALLETVVVPVLLVSILLGLMQFGYVFFVHHTMVNAAREAAQVAARNDSSTGDATTAAYAKLNGLPHAFHVQVQRPRYADYPRSEVRVSITTPMSGLSFGIFGDGDLSARVTLRDELNLARK